MVLGFHHYRFKQWTNARFNPSKSIHEQTNQPHQWLRLYNMARIMALCHCCPFPHALMQELYTTTSDCNSASSRNRFAWVRAMDIGAQFITILHHIASPIIIDDKCMKLTSIQAEFILDALHSFAILLPSLIDLSIFPLIRPEDYWRFAMHVPNVVQHCRRWDKCYIKSHQLWGSLRSKLATLGFC